VHASACPMLQTAAFSGCSMATEARIALQSAARLVDFIVKQPEWSGEKKGSGAVERLKECLRLASLALDEELRQHPKIKSGEDHSGTTAVYGLITPTHIIVGNIGDSRSVMCRDGTTIPMSYDHKPTNPPEKARIEAAGGTVALSRVNGDLAVSRALGDFSYKQMAHLPPEAQQVSPEPEFQVHERTAQDQYLIICCDGIWDVMSNDEVNHYYLQREGADLKQTCCDLLDTCLEKKSRDNMTALGVRLNAR